MLKACPRCGGIHKHGECPIPYKRRYGKVHNGTKEYKFRSSAQWQKKRAEILSRDMYLCRLCMDNGRLMINNLQVHHIIPISVDDSLNRSSQYLDAVFLKYAVLV